MTPEDEVRLVALKEYIWIVNASEHRHKSRVRPISSMVIGCVLIHPEDAE